MLHRGLIINPLRTPRSLRDTEYWTAPKNQSFIQNYRQMTYDSTQLLNELDNAVKDIIDIVETDFATYSPRELNWKPTPEKWSAAECLEHLNIYSRYYNPAMKKAIQEKNHLIFTANFKSAWFGDFSVKSVHPDNAKKQKTLKRLNPIHSELPPTVLENFLSHQQQLRKIISKSRTVNLYKIKIPAEVAKLLKLRLGDCLRFIVAHEQRHIQQAKNVLDGTSPLIA